MGLTCVATAAPLGLVKQVLKQHLGAQALWGSLGTISALRGCTSLVKRRCCLSTCFTRMYQSRVAQLY